MGGIGKTTLAKVVFNKICDRFDCSCFLADVRESSQRKGMEHLQKQLLGDLGLRSTEIRDVDEGIKRIKESFVQKKVLIILDDIDNKKQIHSLARDPSWFGSSSRIIITTRNKEVLETEPLSNRTLEVEVMKPEEARELFCMHAFREDAPPNDYLSLLEDAIASTGLLPLALEVIGSHLRDKSYKKWVAIVNRLKEVPHEDVREKLIISYEALKPKTKQIFLDIACFFIGEEKTYPIYMWEACDFDPAMGLKELINLSLVKFIVEEINVYPREVKRKKFWMHDQLRDLGRKIVSDNSFEDGVKLSRIWMGDDALEMLQEGEGLKNVEMIRLRYHDDPAEGYTFTKRDLSRFRELRYFECYSGKDASWTGMVIPNKLRWLSWHKYHPLLPKLRWLSWHRFHREFMRVQLCLRKLVILDLSLSDIDENWRGWKQFEVGSPLKVLDLSRCSRLKRTPDLSVFSSLERLILSGCTSLVKIDSIGNLENLRVMNTSRTGIERLPSSFGMLKRLEELDTRWTPLEEIPSTIEGLTCLRVFQLIGHHLSLLPPKFPAVLTDVRISSSKILERVPKFSYLRNLVRLVLRDAFPRPGSCKVRPIKLEGIGKLRRLVELELDLWNVTCIPEEGLSSLPQLQKLTLGCPNLQHCPPLPSTLSHFSFWGDEEMTGLPRLSDLKNLLTLELRDSSVGNLGVGELESLTALSLIRCEFGNLGVLHLPSNIRQLNIRDCKSLEALPALSHLKNLKELSIVGAADKLAEIPELGKLDSLTSLSLLWCGFGKLDLPANLRKLHIDHCESLEALPALSHLKNSTELRIEKVQQACISWTNV